MNDNGKLGQYKIRERTKVRLSLKVNQKQILSRFMSGFVANK